MKKILALILALSAGVAHAQPYGLTPPYTGSTVSYTCGVAQNCGALIASLNSATGTLTPLADNTYDVGTTSKGYRTGYFDTSVITPLVSHASTLGLGIAGTSELNVTNDKMAFTGTAALLSTSTADAADNATLTISSAGASGSTRGARIDLMGNEDGSNPGVVFFNAGNVSGGHVIARTNNSAGNIRLEPNASLAWTISGSLGDLAGESGKTLSLQEATAGSACSGTLTANGATPVVTSTTCATTGSRIFLSRTSAETGVVAAWVSALSNGVSFSITGEAGDTGTYNWIIFHEAP